MILVDAAELAVSRPGKPLFADLSVTVASGDRLGVVGINGCGKSTLLQVLAGTREPDAGTVRRGRGARVSVLDQDAPLPAGTVRAVVGGGWEGEAVLERLGMGGSLDADVATLSGGQQRRVLIARALVAGPEVLLLDEPTAGVDAANQRVLAAVLRRLAETGVTMVVVTHELAALRGTVGRIVELEGGRLCFDGTPEGYAVHQAEVVRAASATTTGRAREHSQPGGGHHHEPEPAAGTARILGAGPLDPRPPHGNGAA